MTPVPATAALAPRIAALPPERREAVERAALEFALALLKGGRHA